MFLLSFLLYFSLNIQSQTILNVGQTYQIEGTIIQEPTLFKSSNNEYKTYNFNFQLDTTTPNGRNEYLMVTFIVKKNGVNLNNANFSCKKGTRVNLVGKFVHKSQENNSGLVGALNVNDIELKDIKSGVYRAYSCN